MAGVKSSARRRAIDNDSAQEHRLDEQLGDLGRHLRVCYALIVVCIEALQHQNAEHDADVALVLQQAVGNRLGEQIERAAGLAARLKRSRPGVRGDHGAHPG
jgi:hypothetical protein